MNLESQKEHVLSGLQRKNATNLVAPAVTTQIPIVMAAITAQLLLDLIALNTNENFLIV